MSTTSFLTKSRRLVFHKTLFYIKPTDIQAKGQDKKGFEKYRLEIILTFLEA